MLLILLSCAVPESCERMCDVAAARWAHCVEQFDLGWEATPFADADDQRDACDTWVFEQGKLSDDLDATCAAERRRVTDAACDELL